MRCCTHRRSRWRPRRLWMCWGSRGPMYPILFASAVSLLFFELLERGFYCAPRGLIAFSLAVSDADIAIFIGALRGILGIHHELPCDPVAPAAGLPAHK